MSAVAKEEAAAQSARADGAQVTVDAATKEEAAIVSAATVGSGLKMYIKGWSTWGEGN